MKGHVKLPVLRMVGMVGRVERKAKDHVHLPFWGPKWCSGGESGFLVISNGMFSRKVYSLCG